MSVGKSQSNKLEKIKEGDEIEINDKKYEVVKIQMEADPSPKRNPPIRIYKSIELHKIGNKSLLPKSHLNIYEDNNQIIFFDIEEINSEDVVIKK